MLHCLSNYGEHAHWLLSLNSFLEYPVAPTDVAPGFLDRFLRDYEALSPSASQLLMQTFIVDGPAGVRVGIQYSGCNLRARFALEGLPVVVAGASVQNCGFLCSGSFWIGPCSLDVWNQSLNTTFLLASACDPF